VRATENGIQERLLIEAAQRDPARFAELYESNFDRVYALIARRVQNREAAQDLTAEVFHEALSSLAGFEALSLDCWGLQTMCFPITGSAHRNSRNLQQKTRGSLELTST
jgi:hypothetical protein